MTNYSALTPDARLLLEASATRERIKHFHNRLEESFMENAKLTDELRDTREALTLLCETVERTLTTARLDMPKQTYDALRDAHERVVIYT